MGVRPGQGTKSLQDVQHVQRKKKATYFYCLVVSFFMVLATTDAQCLDPLAH